MVNCLAALPNLSRLSIGFRSPLSRPVEITPFPLTRAVLPALYNFSFEGVSEYLEDLIARINTPQLHLLKLTFFMDLIFDLPISSVERKGSIKLIWSLPLRKSGSSSSIQLGNQMRKARLATVVDDPNIRPTIPSSF
jgi:hypothetical protein